MNRIKAVVVLMQYDYGEKERGYSFEYVNVFLPLQEVLGKENVFHFDFYDEFRKTGKEEMNRKLLELIQSVKPDLSLFCLFTDEISEAVIEKVREFTITTLYLFDDPWRRTFTDYWRKRFDYFTTSDYYMYQEYKSEGIENVVYAPFGFNSSVYIKKELNKIYDVSFVGGYSPLRKHIVDLLSKEGIKVNVFGRGWGEEVKWATHEEMVNIFNQSKINLNISNGISREIGPLIKSLFSFRALKHNLTNKKNKEQVKGRHFEINGCGGFQLSYFVPGLNLVYEIDKEIAVYEGIYNLSDEIKFFLKNGELRESIAEAGYQRSLKDHSSQGYLSAVINQVIKKKNE